MERNPKNMTWLVETFSVQPWLWKRKLTRRFTKKLLTTLTATTARRFPHRWAETSRHDQFIKDSWIYFQSLIYGLRRVGLNPTEEEIRDMINQVSPFLYQVFTPLYHHVQRGRSRICSSKYKTVERKHVYFLAMAFRLSACGCRWSVDFSRSTTLTEESSIFQLSSTWSNRNCPRCQLFVTFCPSHQSFNVPRWTTRRSTKMLSEFSAKTMKVFLFENLSPG